MKWIHEMACVLVCFSAACESAPEEPQTRPAPLATGEHPAGEASDGVSAAKPSIVLSPEDLMTSVAETPPAVVVRTPELDQQTRTAIARGVKLVRWPDRVAIPARVVEHAPDPVANVREWRFELELERALDDGWYALELFLPKGEEVQVEGHALDSRTWVSRFRTGSFPIVKNISIGPGDEQSVVMLELSERISDARSASELVSVSVDGKPVACQPGEGDGLSQPNGVDALAVVCPPLDLRREVSVRLAPRVHALSGKPLVIPFGPSRTELRLPPNAARPDADPSVFRLR